MKPEEKLNKMRVMFPAAYDSADTEGDNWFLQAAYQQPQN